MTCASSQASRWSRPIRREIQLRNHWRVSPGEYVRLRLVDALAQATGSRPDADRILKVERDIRTNEPLL